MGRIRLLSDEVVNLTVAPSEMEAAEICGYLGANGIKATYERGSLNTWVWSPTTPAPGAAGVGPQQILVRAVDAEAANRLLAALRK